MRALQKTFNYENRSLYAEREGKITGVLPLFLVSNWIVGRCLISTPFADYGGVCAEDEESADALVARAVEMGVAEKTDFLELRHRAGKSRPEFYVKDLYVSFATELAAEPEVQLNRLPRDTRYMIRKGEKAGLGTPFRSRTVAGILRIVHLELAPIRYARLFAAVAGSPG